MTITRPQSNQPIPPHAEQVFKGVIFNVYQWEQEMFDGTKAIFEKAGRSDTVIVFPVLPDGRILLTKQEQPGKPPFIAGTGGRIEEGEDPEVAARREMREETGYEASELVLWHSEQPMSKLDYAVYVFIAKGLKQVTGPELDGGEKVELYPVTFDEFLTVGTQRNFAEREIVRFFLEAQISPEKKAALQKLFAV